MSMNGSVSVEHDSSSSVNDQWRLLEERLEITPQGLEFCFEREEFLKNSFDVDRFIVDRKKRVALETLKDDLMAYLRILKSSLVELINQDYADFVNLSTNLVGLDKAITSIQTPMEGLQADIESVNKEIVETITSIETTLARRRDIRNRKTLVQSARSLHHCVDRLEIWLDLKKASSPTTEKAVESRGLGDSCNDEGDDEGRLLERIGTEYTKLQHFVRKCGNQESLLRHVRPRINQIVDRLHARLDAYFLAALPSPGEVVLIPHADIHATESAAWATPARGHRLRTALRTFVGTDRSIDAMILLRRHLLEPLLDDIINETRLTNEGLSNVYDGILSLLPCVLVPLRRLMVSGSSGNPSVTGGPLAELDLVGEALWPSVVDRLSTKLPQVFSAGHADTFHSNYSLTMRMMDQIASMSCKKSLKRHPSTIQFLAKWTLPVYMQLRFQEIASAVEESISVTTSLPTDVKEFRLNTTHVILTQLKRCWEPNVYLPALVHRFWKISLQLLSRYAAHVREMCTDTETEQSPRGLLHQLLDCYALIDESQSVFSQSIQPRLSELGCSTDRIDQVFLPALKEGFDAISQAAQAMETKLIERLQSDCITHLRLVQDVPRQYRKTNREAPSKPSVYASNVLRPLVSFLESNNVELSKEPHGVAVTKRLTIQCLEAVGSRYHDNLSEVLESVRKMEDSLRLLRKARGQATSASAGTGNGMSDDAKIRQQLVLDARHFRVTATSLLPSEQALPSVIETVEALTEREMQS